MNTPVHRAPEEAGATTVLVYAGPFLGGAVMLFTVQFFFLKYGTDVLLLSPAYLGLLFGASKIVDAITDPLIGLWSDRTKHSLGRRRPWLFGATPLLGLCFVAIWLPPQMGHLWTMIWVAVWLILFYVVFTGYNVPHFALGAEISKTPHSKTRLYGARQMVETVGMLIAFIVMQAVSTATIPREAAGTLMIPLALLAMVFLLGTPILQPEYAEHRRKRDRRIRSSLRDIFVNPHATRLFAAWALVLFSLSSLGIMGPFAAEYVLGRPDLIAVIPGVFVVASLVSIPLWIRLAGTFGKIRTWHWGLVGGGGAMLSLFLTTGDNIYWFVGAVAAAGFFLAASTVLGPSVLADVIDDDERRTGERKEGTYASLFTLVSKIGAALVTVLIGLLLSFGGYVPNEVQSEGVRNFLLGAFAGIPAAACVLCALVLRSLDLRR